MSHPDRITIRVIIPHQEDPELHDVNGRGEYPSQDHEAGTGTFEATFRRIGSDVVGRAISVNYRRTDSKNTNEIVYEAKPIDATLDPESGYRWARRSY